MHVSSKCLLTLDAWPQRAAAASDLRLPVFQLHATGKQVYCEARAGCGGAPSVLV